MILSSTGESMSDSLLSESSWEVFGIYFSVFTAMFAFGTPTERQMDITFAK